MFNDKTIVDWKILMKIVLIMKKKLLSLLSHLILVFLSQNLLHNLMECSRNYSKIQYWIFKLFSKIFLNREDFDFHQFHCALSEEKSLMWKQGTHLKVKVDTSGEKKQFWFEIQLLSHVQLKRPLLLILWSKACISRMAAFFNFLNCSR